MEHLDKKTLENVCERLWIARGSLRGVGGLFTQGARDMCLDDDETFGIGQFLKKISEELEALEDILRYNKDND